MQGEGQICLPVYDGVALKRYKTLIPLSFSETVWYNQDHKDLLKLDLFLPSHHHQLTLQ
jgi:hypothetical protein